MNNPPVGPQPEFTQKALDAKFSYSFTRKQLIILVNLIRQFQPPIGDMRSRVLIDVLDEIERTAIASITPDDYVKEASEPLNHVETN